jgi:hypothetical protein
LCERTWIRKTALNCIRLVFLGHKKAQAAATQKLQAAEAEKEAEPLSLEERLSKENLEAEVDLAASLDKKFRNGWGQQTKPM